MVTGRCRKATQSNSRLCRDRRGHKHRTFKKQGESGLHLFGRKGAPPFRPFLFLWWTAAAIAKTAGFRVCVRTGLDASFILQERRGAMGKFFDYNPDQAYLLSPRVRDVLGEGHLCFFLRRLVGKMVFLAFLSEFVARCGSVRVPVRLGSV